MTEQEQMDIERLYQEHLKKAKAFADSLLESEK